MFLGTYEHAIDAKGRLFIPVKLREESGENGSRFILTKGLEMCLYLYDPKIFNEVLVSRLNALPVKNQQDGRAFKRMLLSGAQEVALDDLGRILLPKPLMEYAAIDKDVAILGVGERIELWSRQKWMTYNKKASSTFQRIGKQLEI